jgi:hypothetical protein
MPEPCRDIEHQQSVSEREVCIKLAVLLHHYKSSSIIFLKGWSKENVVVTQRYKHMLFRGDGQNNGSR